jgi:hypothetical protein
LVTVLLIIYGIKAIGSKWSLCALIVPFASEHTGIYIYIYIIYCVGFAVIKNKKIKIKLKLQGKKKKEKEKERQMSLLIIFLVDTKGLKLNPIVVAKER